MKKEELYGMAQEPGIRSACLRVEEKGLLYLPSSWVLHIHKALRERFDTRNTEYSMPASTLGVNSFWLPSDGDVGEAVQAQEPMEGGRDEGRS